MCQSNRIAESSVCALDLCGHGRLTLSVGPVSMRLEAGALRELSQLLEGVVPRLERELRLAQAQEDLPPHRH